MMRTLRFINILCCALVLRLTLTHVLQAPGSRGLDGASWLMVQHTFYGGFAVVGGIAEIVGLITAATNAVLLRRWPRAAAAPAIAALCLLGTLLAYWFGNRPVNTQVAKWTPATLPADWPTYRDTWETAHAVSAALSAVATVALLLATIWPPVERDEPAPWDHHRGQDTDDAADCSTKQVRGRRSVHRPRRTTPHRRAWALQVVRTPLVVAAAIVVSVLVGGAVT